MSEILVPDIACRLGEQLNMPVDKVRAVMGLLDRGATVPFIARYRKELTGGLDEVGIENIRIGRERLAELDHRREFIAQAIAQTGAMTARLRSLLAAATSMQMLEDIYQPFRPKRKTRAQSAVEQGLAPLAEALLSGMVSGRPDVFARGFVDGRKGVNTVDAALSGACDIIAQKVAEDVDIRQSVRMMMRRSARLSARVVKSHEHLMSGFENYRDFSRMLGSVRPHQYLALCRAETKGVMRLDMDYDDERIIGSLSRRVLKRDMSQACRSLVQGALIDAYKRLLRPSFQNQLRAEKKVEADKQAVAVFASNVRQLLMAPPLGACAVMGIDPGFRSGCKVACINAGGALTEHAVVYPVAPRCDVAGAEKVLRRLISKHGIKAIALGNGTASRECESALHTMGLDDIVDIHVVSEAGASVYSASEVARREFPDEDITVRGAVSIARRLVDPLAELVKIDPKSIGVGQYQHDVDQCLLHDSLSNVVQWCVNLVGVDVNTASRELLTYVSGIGPSLAEAIVDMRCHRGVFKNRSELLLVPRLGPRAFEQCAGFLRVNGGDNVLDSTAVHPERYDLVRTMARDCGCNVAKFIGDVGVIDSLDLNKYVAGDVGMPTLHDIVSELKRPGRDPRGSQSQCQFMPSVHGIGDLCDGMVLNGVVSNITSFGAFVNIGVKKDGLVHVSQMSGVTPEHLLHIGQCVSVRVLEVDVDAGRISLGLVGKDVGK